MKVVLELLKQSSNIKRVTVRHDIVIGRGSDCNLRVSAPQVSRRHCFLRIDGENVSITDLESCNGTWLDGQKTVAGKRYFLQDGMQLAVGPVRFIVRITEQQVAADVLPETPAASAPAPAPAKPSDAMEFSIEHTGDSAEQDEPTVDYGSDQSDSAVMEPDEIELLDEIEIIEDEGAQSEEVILIEDATDVIDQDIAVEAVELVVAEIEDDDFDSQELLVAEEISEEDSGEALRDFLQNKD